MQDGICPKCGATDIFRQPINTPPAAEQFPENSLDRYLCQHCGYLETYMDRSQAASVVTTSAWTRIPPAAPVPIAAPATGDTIRLTYHSNDPLTPPVTPLDLALEHVCPVCGAETIVPGVQICYGVRAARAEVTAEIEQFPAAFFFKYPVVQALRARICGSCGYLVLAISRPEEFYKVYQQHFNGAED